MIGIHLKSCGQNDLADDGKCAWDDGIRSGLDREWHDWKDPKKTCMVPDSFPSKRNNDVGARAEEVVYNLLWQLGTQNSEPMFVVHSYVFSEHIPGYGRKRSWVMGESDFVIIHREHGPVFIQVKATVTGDKYKEAEDQLHKDKLSLEKFLQKLEDEQKISKRQVTELFKNFPAFVAMPNCPRGVKSICGKANVLCQEDCSSLEAFAKWWNENIRKAEHPKVTQSIFEYLVMRFVGSVMSSQCLPSGSSIDETYQFLKFNTREQLKVLLDSSPEKWIVGPAGSGKTSLLLEKVTKLAWKILVNSLNEKILVVCYNRPLSLMIREVFENELKHMLQGEELSSVVDVKTFDKLLKDICGSFNVADGEKGVMKAVKKLEEKTFSERACYEHVFVDEGQDLYGAQWQSLLTMLHRGSSNDAAAEDDDFDPRYFWVFYDSNQHLHLSKEKISPHSRSLKNSTRLHQVLRNTKNIFVQFEKYFEPIVKLSSPVGVYHGRDGLKIKWDDSLKSEVLSGDGSGEQCVLSHLKYLERNKVTKQDICVLVRAKKERDRLMKSLQKFGVLSQNAEELWTAGEINKIIVESIRRFKGLESKVVMLYNPPFRRSGVEDKMRELLYTSVSRSACFLIVISTQEGCKALQSIKGFDDVFECYTAKSIPVHSSQLVAATSKSAADTITFHENAAKGPSQDGMYHDVLYKKTKEMVGDVGGRLLQPRNENIEDSLRNLELAKLLPSVWQNLQLCPEYKDISQPSLNRLVGLVEFRVLVSCKSGNHLQYIKDMKRMKEEIDASFYREEVNTHVAGALGLTRYQPAV